MEIDLKRFILPENQRFGDAETLDDEHIPLIDLASDHEKIVRAVDEACKKWGFFQVINHGVPDSILQDVLQVAREFFSLPHDEKAAYHAKNQNKGVNDPAGVVNYSLGFLPEKEQVREMRYGLRLLCNYVDKLDAWPERPASFKSVVMEYNKHMTMLIKHLLEIISQALGLAPDCILKRFIAQEHDEPRRILLMNYYPCYSKPREVMGVTPHSDPGGITILLQDALGGLEVCRDGKWFAINPIENSFVVNLGDQLQVLTNGIYKSAEHRVKVNHKEPRMSVPSFCDPTLSATIGPIPELVDPKSGAKYRECTTKEFMDHFFSRPLAGKSALDYLTI